MNYFQIEISVGRIGYFMQDIQEGLRMMEVAAAPLPNFVRQAAEGRPKSQSDFGGAAASLIPLRKDAETRTGRYPR